MAHFVFVTESSVHRFCVTFLLNCLCHRNEIFVSFLPARLSLLTWLIHCAVSTSRHYQKDISKQVTVILQWVWSLLHAGWCYCTKSIITNSLPVCQICGRYVGVIFRFSQFRGALK